MKWQAPSDVLNTLFLPLANANPDIKITDCTCSEDFSVKISHHWLSIWNTPKNNSASEICQNLIDLLKPIAELSLIAQNKIPIHAKDEPHDLVTETDIGIELLLKHWFDTHLPSHKLVGEESKKPLLTSTDICWYIDPIDGTANYAEKKSNFCINLGSTYKGAPYVNIIYHPPTHTYHYQTPTETSYTPSPSIPKTICTEYYPHRILEDKRFKLILKKTQWTAFQTQALGVSLFEMINGKCGAFFKPSGKPWDIIAGTAILATTDQWDITFFTKDHQEISLFSNSTSYIDYLNEQLATNCRIGTLIITPKQAPQIKEIIIKTLFHG